ncbi:rRNA maturation RNase YbeY [Flavobacteriaceae bacterium F89]|uniref:Endoribonuclease YbeY n=1 Tax=Cerina litoralis TaxID=2874477 RepID=A0AAE3JMW1_9FLAO|nr:rRNA maturation RNase YbeY [Cerina litoralis]MCG2459211.1 rRNA maturation RNase YbeY [Cerina litoralis]
MIEYNYELDFKLNDESYFADWITRIIALEGHMLGSVSFIFCDDEYLLSINKKYLDHDTYTDIITFDYTEGSLVSGDVFISVDRIIANASEFGVAFREELIRVMAHGVLHMLGYKDKNEIDTKVMRSKEEEMINLFHVEH